MSGAHNVTHVKLLADLRAAAEDSQPRAVLVSPGEVAMLLDLLEEITFQHKDSSKFERARRAMAEALR